MDVFAAVSAILSSSDIAQGWIDFFYHSTKAHKWVETRSANQNGSIFDITL